MSDRQVGLDDGRRQLKLRLSNVVAFHHAGFDPETHSQTHYRGGNCKIDTLLQGLLLHAIVHPADIQDRDGGIMLLATLFGTQPFLKKLFADAAYQGPGFHGALAKILPDLETEIVKRSDQVKGFVVLPKRWIVERTIAWLNRCRRLAKDWENLNRKGLAFLRLASIRLMLRKLCNPT